MIETKELAEICHVSLKTITKWAANNGVSKIGYRWNFTPDDCRKLFEHYQVELNEVPLNLRNELFTENESKLPINEPLDEANESDSSFEDEQNEANESANETNEQLVEAYRKQVEILEKQVQIQIEQLAEKDKQIENQSAQISELISTNKALSASNAVHVASDKKEILLAEQKGDDLQETEKKGFWQRLFGM